MGTVEERAVHMPDGAAALACEDPDGHRYESENHLVEDLLGWLVVAGAPWDAAGVVREFSYRRGTTDVVVLTSAGEVVAIEAKLRRWRDALHQAYRNTCFAHQSYVVLPRAAARLAQCHLAEFERRGVGLCCLDALGIVVLHESRRQDPLLPWLSREALSRADRQQRDATHSA